MKIGFFKVLSAAGALGDSYTVASKDGIVDLKDMISIGITGANAFGLEYDKKGISFTSELISMIFSFTQDNKLSKEVWMKIGEKVANKLGIELV